MLALRLLYLLIFYQISLPQTIKRMLEKMFRENRCACTFAVMNYAELASRLTQNDVTLVAVSKTQPPARLMELYHAGQRIFGENRVQEMLEKRVALPDDIQWHLIGHLDRKSVV